MMDDQLHGNNLFLHQKRILIMFLIGYYLHGKAPSGVAEGDTFWLKEAIE